jgi:NADPH:quinone reductase-like Zn-dependent oxidoreductase
MTETMTERIPAVMRAVRLHPPGGPTRLVVEQVATPRPAAGEALVGVHAAAITRDELDWPTDRLPAIPSYEFSGVVAAVAGDAVPLAALSAWQALFDHGHLREGQLVLVHGAGGVGGFAVQLARWRGAHVAATASTGNVAAARRLGADQVVDHLAGRFEDAVGQVDLVVDTVGGERLRRSPAVLRRGGRLVSVAETPSAEDAAARGITAIYFVVAPNRGQLVKLAGLIDGGELRPTVDRVFPLADARAAFQLSLGDHRPGKIVLRVADEQAGG